MTLVVLRLNWKLYLQECHGIKSAREQAGVWLAEAKKSYPNKEFTPRYYSIRHKEAPA